MLKQALKDLNIDFVEAKEGQQLSITCFNKEKKDVLIELKTGGPQSAGIIFNEETETYEFVADWWGVENYTEMNEEQYVNYTQYHIINQCIVYAQSAY